MNELSTDVLIGALCFAGISSFISGLFIFSAAAFAAAAMFSNMADKGRA